MLRAGICQVTPDLSWLVCDINQGIVVDFDDSFEVTEKTPRVGTVPRSFVRLDGAGRAV